MRCVQLCKVSGYRRCVVVVGIQLNEKNLFMRTVQLWEVPTFRRFLLKGRYLFIGGIDVCEICTYWRGLRKRGICLCKWSIQQSFFASSSRHVEK